ncbi:MAG: TetR/AcrR family transcriptional regulator [Dermatophilaceae bacterium]
MSTDVSAGDAPAALAVRRRLLDATCRLVYRHGVARTSVQAIAAAAGVAKMSLYRQFPGGKDELIAVALADQSERTVQHLLDAARTSAGHGSETDPVAVLLALFDVIDAQSRRPGWRGCPFVNAAGELPAGHPGREVVLAHKRRLHAHLRGLVRAVGGQEDLHTEGLVQTIAILIDGVLVASGLTPEAHPAHVARQTTAELLSRVTQRPLRPLHRPAETGAP